MREQFKTISLGIPGAMLWARLHYAEGESRLPLLRTMQNGVHHTEEMSTMEKGVSHWESYEEVARYLLCEFRREFGLDVVGGKQVLKGKGSSASWEVDAKGVRESDSAVFIVECRRRTTRRIDQESLAALAYKIQDTGAAGGIVVSPLGLQEGAKRVAASCGILSVTLSPESTADEFAIGFLRKLCLRFSDRSAIRDHVSIRLMDKDGNITKECDLD